MLGSIFTQSGIAVDRFAREIVAILALSDAARSRQLNAKPLGGSQPYSCLVFERRSLVLWLTNAVLFRWNQSSVV